MSNPWKYIRLDDYESHMRLESVYQLQTMNQMMKEQFGTYNAQSIMILGIAGGNGLEHIDTNRVNKVYGIDINENYLNTCIQRYKMLQRVFEPLCLDLTYQAELLPYADFVVANLFVEYIGCECFCKVIAHIKPKFISCVIQVNTDATFVSDSPYSSVFKYIEEVHHYIESHELNKAMNNIGYLGNGVFESKLPNGKKLVRIDFVCQK